MSQTSTLIRAEFDLCANIPSLADLRTSVLNNDWESTEAYFDFLDHEDDRAIASSVVTGLSTAERFLEQVVAERPGSALARTRAGRTEQSELDSARAKILKVYDTPDAGAARLPSYALNLLCGHRNLTPDEHRAELAAVTVGDLRDVARELHSTALIQVPGRDVEWAGFTSAPQWSTTSRALAGTTHRSPGNDDVALVVGPRSVTLRTPGGEITVRYEACAALQVFPDGARHLTGLDGFTVAVEPTLYDRLGPDRVAVIDAGVPAAAVVRMPERDADSIPRPASSPGGGLKSRTRSALRSLRIGRRG